MRFLLWLVGLLFDPSWECLRQSTHNFPVIMVFLPLFFGFGRLVVWSLLNPLKKILSSLLLVFKRLAASYQIWFLLYHQLRRSSRSARLSDFLLSVWVDDIQFNLLDLLLRTVYFKLQTQVLPLVFLLQRISAFFFKLFDDAGWVYKNHF